MQKTKQILPPYCKNKRKAIYKKRKHPQTSNANSSNIKDEAKLQTSTKKEMNTVQQKLTMISKALSFLLLLMILVSSVHCRNGSHRRVLHQPLYPESSYPTPDTNTLLLTPPPPDTYLLPPSDSSDQPFFPESGTQDQTPVTPPPPPPPPININITTTTHPTNTNKKAAIAISIIIATLVLASGLVFFIICRKNTKKHSVQQTKREGVINGAPPSRFLYIGTVNPHNTRTPSSSPSSQHPTVSSPDVIKHAIIPSIKKTPPPQEAPKLQPLPPEKKNVNNVFELKSSLPKRAKFGPRTPPPPNLALLQSITSHSLQPPSPPPKVRTTWTKFINKPSESASDSHGDNTEGTKPKLKPLHWEKVRANSDKATAWDQLKPSSFQLNEDLMESLFGCNSNKTASKESNRRPPVVAVQENRVLDPNKSQNIAILLRALNVTRDEVSQALRDGSTRALGAEVLETLMKMAPTKEEEIKLTGYKGDTSKLGSAEKFLKAILDVPFAFKRVESMLYQANFDAEVKYLIKSFQTLAEASSELKNSKLFLKLLEAVLTTGNRMNIGTNRGGAKSFKLDTLLKLVDIKGIDGKTTLLHFVVQEIGSFTVTGLGREVKSVKLAAGLDSDVLHSSVLKLETGFKKVRAVLECEKMEGKFLETMKVFYGKAEEDICRVKKSEGKALNLVREVTEYFHGDLGKEERSCTRIFVIVRDFLLTLDYVCKDMGMVISDVRQDYSSSDESSSP